MVRYPSGLRGRSAKPLFIGSNPIRTSESNSLRCKELFCEYYKNNVRKWIIDRFFDKILICQRVILKTLYFVCFLNHSYKTVKDLHLKEPFNEMSLILRSMYSPYLCIYELFTFSFLIVLRTAFMKFPFSLRSW